MSGWLQAGKKKKLGGGVSMAVKADPPPPPCLVSPYLAILPIMVNVYKCPALAVGAIYSLLCASSPAQLPITYPQPANTQLACPPTQSSFYLESDRSSTPCSDYLQRRSSHTPGALQPPPEPFFRGTDIGWGTLRENAYQSPVDRYRVRGHEVFEPIFQYRVPSFCTPEGQCFPGYRFRVQREVYPGSYFDR